VRVSLPGIAILAALAAHPLASHAQAGAPVRVSAAGTELRASPDGGRVGTLSRGASLTPGAANGAWREVTLEGWVPAASVAPAGAGGRVAVQGSATLRSAPDGGGPVATAFGGAVLREVERRGTWVRVRRTGWVRAEGIGGASAPAATAARPARDTSARTAAATRSASAPTVTRPAATASPARPAVASRSAAAPATPTRTGTAPAAPRPAVQTPPSATTTAARPAAPARTTTLATASATTPARPASVPATAAMAVRPAAPAASTAPATTRRTPVVLHGAPGGSQVAVVDPGASVQVLVRQGEWTRVRVEGWTRSPLPGAPAASAPSNGVSTTAAPAGVVTLAALRADPDAFVGREVDWSLRFVAVQLADSLRSDFRPGEPFVLARDPNGETGFVYVAVTAQQAAAMRRFAPLQPFRMVGRIRVPRSPLMGHPIVELVRLR
jgi:hypothetical protein